MTKDERTLQIIRIYIFKLLNIFLQSELLSGQLSKKIIEYIRKVTTYKVVNLISR